MNPRPQRRIRFADTPVPAEGQADSGVAQNTDMLAKAYAYHITVQWWFFAAAGIVALSIALLTISFQAIKAAIANPVNSLRTE